MSDVFLSYSHHGERDRSSAGLLAAIFAERGWSVFWDHRIRAGVEWDRTLERELEQARVVVVLWSASSRERRWVREEAAAAHERGVLVPALLEAVKPPLGLRLIQAADLSDWQGEGDHPGLAALIEAVGEVITTGSAQYLRRAAGLLNFRRPREVVIAAAQIVAAFAVPFVAHRAGLAPLSEASQTWTPALLASVATAALVVAGLALTRLLSVRWRLIAWLGIGLAGLVASLPAAFGYWSAFQRGTVEVEERHGDVFRPARRVRGTELTDQARRYLERHPELKGEDGLLRLAPIDRIWTAASIGAQWRRLTVGFTATMALIVLAFFGLTQALRIPLWRAWYAVRGAEA